MSSIWTPGGEHQVPRPGDEPGPSTFDDDDDPVLAAEAEAELAAIQEELARTPAAVVITNHAVGLFQLAAVHLSQQPPQLTEAQLAIDGLGALVEGLRGRLGEHEVHLAEMLAQIRLAFVQLRAAAEQAPEQPPPA